MASVDDPQLDEADEADGATLEGAHGADVGEASPEDSEEVGVATAIFDQALTLVIAIAIALAIRHFIVEPFRIPSGSMFPTLLVGDHLFVDKLAYGPRIPFTEIRLPGRREPERGDVIVFEVARPGGAKIMPVDQAPAGARREDFVKRLVGLPGDRISWRRGEVFVNGEPLRTTRAEQDFVEEATGQRFDTSWEDLGDCRHAVLKDPRSRDLRFERGTYVVEPGRYFMMGDNRDNSNDSRGWGTVRLEELKGPAFILYWSWDVNGNMLSFFNPVNWWTADKRWDRLFKRVKCDAVEAPAGS